MKNNPQISEDQAHGMMQSDEKVMEFISSVKWAGHYSCRFCGNSNYCNGKTPFSRRCTRCKKEESATAHTLFHNLKFPLHKAFYIAYDLCIRGNDISVASYAQKLGINPMTCWKFRRRITKCQSLLPPGSDWKQILLSNSKNPDGSLTILTADK